MIFLKENKFYGKGTKKDGKNCKNPPPKVKIITGDARKLEVESKSVDLIVTSSPYDRAYMYNMLWLGIDFDLFRKHEIGAHSHFIYNRFRLL